ncbi:response regulator transcription factor [Shewanella sp. JL219SE-S6]
MKEKILLIEDDLPLAELICTYLANEGFEPVHLDNAEAALARQDSDSFSLILCDVMLPGEDGFGIYPRLAACYPCPLIFLTARDSEGDQILGLELGACDYLLKPVVPPCCWHEYVLNFVTGNSCPDAKLCVCTICSLIPISSRCFWRARHWPLPPRSLNSCGCL